MYIIGYTNKNVNLIISFIIYFIKIRGYTNEK